MRKPVSTFLYNLRRRLFGDPPPRVAVVRLYGVIAPGQRFRQNLNLASISEALDEAFSLPGLSAVALQINSPGGSPVQSEMITRRIRDLAREKDVPVLAFAEDVAASGGYMLALAGDEIYANNSSIIGSIGVVASGFGFHKVIEKLGIDRRLYAAGEKKAMLDAFQPENDEDVERLKELQAEVHEHFKALVRERRGKRLKGLRGRIFSGEVFTGAEAVKMGLVDSIGDVRGVLRDRFGKKVQTRLVGERKPRLGAMLGLGRGDAQGQTGIGRINDLPHGLVSAIEERLFWNRFGL